MTGGTFAIAHYLKIYGAGAVTDADGYFPVYGNVCFDRDLNNKEVICLEVIS